MHASFHLKSNFCIKYGRNKCVLSNNFSYPTICIPFPLHKLTHEIKLNHQDITSISTTTTQTN